MSYAKYRAIDIARYIINYSCEIGSPMSNLKLQKVLYFVQGNFIRKFDRPCFTDDILAWNYGPVVKSVYKEFKKYGSNNINKIEYYYEFDPYKFTSVKKQFFINLSIDEKKVIDGVVDACKKLSAGYLVELTHNQSPWIKAYNNSNNKIITIDLLKEYFQK